MISSGAKADWVARSRLLVSYFGPLADAPFPHLVILQAGMI